MKDSVRFNFIECTLWQNLLNSNMRSPIFVILAWLISSCCSRESYSALSCILRRSYHSEEQFNEVLNVTDDESLKSKINFRLHTRQSLEGAEIIFKDKESLKESGFNANLQTRIITHGFNGRGVDDACMGPMKAFLSKGHFNVIIMDWSGFQSSINYFDAVRKVKPTALHLLEMMDFLEEHGVNASTTTLIGHSLGAHVVGVAGYNSKSQINHVVGIDPAEPSFENKGPGERISREDATHVEIIHTNAGHCGIKEAIGHYDFYPNGGSEQPGCNKNSCSHNRSHVYYTESITSTNGFYGRRCIDAKNIIKDECTGKTALMGGLDRSRASPGAYYVDINSESPYAKGHPDKVMDFAN